MQWRFLIFSDVTRVNALQPRACLTQICALAARSFPNIEPDEIQLQSTDTESTVDFHCKYRTSCRNTRGPPHSGIPYNTAINALSLVKGSPIQVLVSCQVLTSTKHCGDILAHGSYWHQDKPPAREKKPNRQHVLGGATTQLPSAWPCPLGWFKPGQLIPAKRRGSGR